MSMHALRWARGVRGVTATQKLVLLLLADTADDDDMAWPSGQRLADDAALSRRAVVSALADLERLGLIEPSVRELGHATRWHLQVGAIPQPADLGCEPRSQGGVNDVHRGCEPASQGGVNQIHTGCEPRAQGGVNHVLTEPPYNPHRTHNPSGAASPPLVGPIAPPPDARAALWTEGLARLRRLTGQGDRASRGLLGRMTKAARDDCALVSSVLFDAESLRPGDPVAWITATIRSRSGQRDPPANGSKTGWLAEEGGLFGDEPFAAATRGGVVIDATAEDVT